MTSNNDDNVNLEKLNISDEIINDYDNGSQEQLDVLEAYQTDEDKQEQEQKEKEKDVELDNPDLEEEVGITMNDDEGDHKLNNQKIDDEINKEDEKDVKASDDDHDDDDDDDFDDFNEASFQQAPTIGSTNQENGHDGNDDDDDEFGDFDDFQVSQPSPTQQQQQKQQSQTQSQSISIDKVNFPTTIFNSPKEFSQRLTTTLDEIFPTSTPILEDNNNKNQITTSIQLLNERSQEIYKQLSTLPYLQPTNWIKSNIRHNLLIKLGIPINLDELNDTNTISANPNNKNIVTSETQNDLKIPGYNFGSGGGGGSGGGFVSVSVSGRQRKSSISINDINWNELNLISEIPKFESLNIDDNLKNSLINSTLDKLNQFELDNLYHNSTTTTTTTTISVTTAAEGDGSSNNNNNNNKSNSSSNDSGSTIGGGHANSQWIDEKLNKLTSNYNELLTLSSIWINQIDQLHEEFEIYENVIQSFIGYNQKLRREEIFENLKKLKKKKKKGKATK
ncbi:hypothetical protein MG7_01612 [Candida albicans P34048]|nr:hypothetical protein MG7_01612 [Candida albicans P34048]